MDYQCSLCNYGEGPTVVLLCLEEDGTRQTRLRGADRKVARDKKSAPFRCHRLEMKTHGHVTLHQPLTLWVRKKLLNCNIMALRTGSVSAPVLLGCVLFLLCVCLCPCGPATSCDGLTREGERSLVRLLTKSDSQ